MAAKRVILDTNLLISFLISQKLDAIDALLLQGKLTLLFSAELIEEFLTVVSRPKFKKYFNATAIEKLIVLLYDRVEWIEISQHFHDCRDKKDNFLLDLSVSGHADYLVTGDDDLLILNPFYGIEIVSYQTFQAL